MASPFTHLLISNGNDFISVANVQEISKLDPLSGKELLAKVLEISPYIDDADPQKELYISYLYDNIMFAVERGFPWKHVCHTVKFANSFLGTILAPSHNLVDSIADLEKNAYILGPLNDRHKKQFTDFIITTVLFHYNLYKYTFTNLREHLTPKITKIVAVPPTLPPLSTGVDKTVWEYNEKVKAVEAEEMKATDQQDKLKQQLSLESTRHKTLSEVDDSPHPCNPTFLKELVNDVLSGYTEKKEDELKIKVDEMVTRLDYKFQKTAIPRPAKLGPPPRFKLNSPDIDIMTNQNPKTNMKRSSINKTR